MPEDLAQPTTQPNVPPPAAIPQAQPAAAPSPVTLDFSTAQPIEQPQQQAKPAGPVTLDFSTAQPIDPAAEKGKSLLSRFGQWLKEADQSGVNTEMEAGKGVLKSAARSAYGVSKLATTVVPGASALIPKVAETNTADELAQKVSGNPKATLQSTNSAQSVGAFGEQAAEWASGEELLKGLMGIDAIAKMPVMNSILKSSHPAAKLIRSLGRIGRSTTVGTAVGGAQGAAEGDAAEGAKSGAEAGIVGGTLAEGISWIVKTVGESLNSGKDAMNEKTLSGIKDTANKIVNGIPAEASETQYGEAVLSKVREAKEALSQQFEALEKQVIENPQNVDVAASMPGVNITKVKSPMFTAARNAKVSQAVVPTKELTDLGKTAEQMISEDFRVPPGREDVAALGTAESKVVDLMRDVSDPTKPLSIEDALSMKNRLRSAAEGEGLTTKQVGAVKNFVNKLNDKIYGTLDQVAPTYSAKLKSANAAYEKFNDAINNGTLSNMFDTSGSKVKLGKDATKVGSYLWANASENSVKDVKTLIGDKNFPVAQKAVLNYLWQESLQQSVSGGDAGKKFVALWMKGGAEGQQAFFQGPLLEQLNGLAKDLQKKPSLIGTLLHAARPILYGHAGGVMFHPKVLAEMSTTSRGVKLLREAISDSKNPQGINALRLASQAWETSQQGEQSPGEQDSGDKVDPNSLYIPGQP